MTRELSSFNPPDHVLEQLAELAAKECSFVVKGIRSFGPTIQRNRALFAHPGTVND